MQTKRSINHRCWWNLLLLFKILPIKPVHQDLNCVAWRYGVHWTNCTGMCKWCVYHRAKKSTTSMVNLSRWTMCGRKMSSWGLNLVKVHMTYIHYIHYIHSYRVGYIRLIIHTTHTYMYIHVYTCWVVEYRVRVIPGVPTHVATHVPKLGTLVHTQRLFSVL